MKVEYFDINSKNNNCILRSLSKALDIKPDTIEKELLQISDNYADEKVWDEYLKDKGFIIDEYYKGKLLSEVSLNNLNIVFAYNNEWYHMLTVINNVIYDKHSYEDLKCLKIIKIYKK